MIILNKSFFQTALLHGFSPPYTASSSCRQDRTRRKQRKLARRKEEGWLRLRTKTSRKRLRRWWGKPSTIGKTSFSGSAWLELVLMENSCGKNPRGNLTSKTGLQMNQAVTKNAQTWKLMLHNFLGLAGNVKILQGILFVRNDTHSFWIKKQMNQE